MDELEKINVYRKQPMRLEDLKEAIDCEAVEIGYDILQNAVLSVLIADFAKPFYRTTLKISKVKHFHSM